MKQEILEFYKQTSPFTDLGYYKEFAKDLPDDIEELCLLQRMQIIHPITFKEPNIRTQTESDDGNMTQVPITRLEYEDDIFPTAQSVIAELLRKDSNYTINRAAKDKVHVTCRGQAILLASILKAKGIPARVRSGFAGYVSSDEIYYDHWITEYFDKNNNKWKLVDADEYVPGRNMHFILNNKFLFGADAYLGLRENKYAKDAILYASTPPTLGLEAAIRGLFYDFHSLMNNEIIFLHMPKYIQEKKLELSKEEYLELDELATIMLEPDKNFNKLQKIWNTNYKFRILSGGLND